MSKSDELENYIDSLGLRYFSGREFTPYWNRVARGVRNSLPPRSLWANIVEPLVVLDNVRHHHGSPITLTSTYRSPTYNTAVRGAINSLHVDFNAIDFSSRAGNPVIWARIARSLRGVTFMNPATKKRFEFKGGIGIYNAQLFVHIDTRGYNADW